MPTMPDTQTCGPARATWQQWRPQSFKPGTLMRWIMAYSSRGAAHSSRSCKIEIISATHGSGYLDDGFSALQRMDEHGENSGDCSSIARLLTLPDRTQTTEGPPPRASARR